MAKKGTKNTGVILGKRTTDWIAGGASNIVYEVRNPSGDWTPYIPKGEVQHTNSVDYMDCVTRSLLNSIEIQHKFLTGTEVNYSDRFLAKMSGTTHQGNYLWAVADTLRSVGVVKEEDHPTIDNMTWDDYYAEISQWLKDKAKKWFDENDLKYEWIEPITVENLIKHLKQAPLQIVIPGHAVVDILQKEDIYKYFDSYKPFVKDRKELPQAVLKPVLTRKINMKPTSEEIKKLYREIYHREATPQEIAFWSAKSLTEFLDTVRDNLVKLLNGQI
jgi:hypothetical protein